MGLQEALQQRRLTQLWPQPAPLPMIQKFAVATHRATKNYGNRCRTDDVGGDYRSVSQFCMALSPFHASTTNDLCAPDDVCNTHWQIAAEATLSSAIRRGLPRVVTWNRDKREQRGEEGYAGEEDRRHGHFDIPVDPGRPPGWPTE